MNHFARRPALALCIAAGAISACSDGTAPATLRPNLRTAPSASRALDPNAAASTTTIDVPGSTATVVFGINDEGMMVGRYMVGSQTHGFARTAAGDFTSIDFPGASFTVAGALNNRGDIVGWYSLPASQNIRHGFLLRDGKFTSFDPTGSTFTNTLGINDRGDIVGRFCTLTACPQAGNGAFHGFLLRDGVITLLDVPGSKETNVWKINDRGEIFGGFGPASGGVALFLVENGELTTFALPNGKPLSEDTGGLNIRGDIVGKYCDASPCLIGPTGHGFAIMDGNLTTIDIPRSVASGTFGINAHRQVVGGYYDAAGVLHGYVMSLGGPQD